MRIVLVICGGAFTVWAIVAASVSALDVNSGMPINVWNDVVYVLAFFGAGLAFLWAAGRRYLGGWFFIGGVLLAHFGLVLVSAFPAQVREGTSVIEMLLVSWIAFAVAAGLLRRGHREHLNTLCSSQSAADSPMQRDDPGGCG